MGIQLGSIFAYVVWGKNEKHTFCQKKKWKVNSKKMQNYQKKKKEIYDDVKTAWFESKQTIGYPRLALKSQVLSFE